MRVGCSLGNGGRRRRALARKRKSSGADAAAGAAAGASPPSACAPLHLPLTLAATASASLHPMFLRCAMQCVCRGVAAATNSAAGPAVRQSAVARRCSRCGACGVHARTVEEDACASLCSLTCFCCFVSMCVSESRSSLSNRLALLFFSEAFLAAVVDRPSASWCPPVCVTEKRGPHAMEWTT